MDKARVVMGVRVASIVLVLAAIIVQAIVLANNGAFDATRFFAYFTIQSNFVGVAAYAWLVANGSRPRSRALESFRGAATSYLTVVFFVVIALLSSVDVGLQLVWVDFVLHKLFPVVVVIDWLVDPPTERLSARDALAWLIYPLVWVALTLVRGEADKWYPYPFLDPANGGYGSVVLTSAAITIGFLAIAGIWIWIGNRLGRAEVQVARP